MCYSTFNNKYFQFYVHYTTCCYCHLGRITAIPDGSKLLSFTLIIQAIPPTWLALLPTWLVLQLSFTFILTCIIFVLNCIIFNLYYYCITVLSLPTLCPFPLYGIYIYIYRERERERERERFNGN